MSEMPSQDQINALLEEARRSASAVQLTDKAENASVFDLRQSKPMSENATRAVSTLHESFARNVNDSLGSYLRAGVEAKLASVEQKSFAEYSKDFPEPTYFSSIRLLSLATSAFIQIDLPLALQMLDLMLGGEGKQPVETRDLTEIEQEIFESAVRILCDELRAAWKPVLETEVRFDRRVKPAQAPSLIPASERLLLITFDVALAEGQGKLRLAFPASVATALIRDAAPESPFSETPNLQRHQARLREVLADSVFDAELMLPPSPVSVREVFSLQPGSIVVLNVRASEPIHLNVAGKRMFLAVPVGCGSQRGAQIERALSIAPAKESK
ncbi:MAG TPA: flagellar motor switch protein FliM [Candidatus Acidoferrum sp.]|jgi:flagellar motor switch protein FliM|nr:flagellar motor switch protein FliM [Candidatus Acidoferrum sp.]